MCKYHCHFIIIIYIIIFKRDHDTLFLAVSFISVAIFVLITPKFNVPIFLKCCMKLNTHLSILKYRKYCVSLLCLHAETMSIHHYSLPYILFTTRRAIYRFYLNGSSTVETLLKGYGFAAIDYHYRSENNFCYRTWE